MICAVYIHEYKTKPFELNVLLEARLVDYVCSGYIGIDEAVELGELITNINS